MKQKIFTLLMMLALVVAGGKAFGQGKFAPYPGGGDYSYSIPYTLANDGSATLGFDNGDGITLNVTAPASLAAIGAGSGNITFTANYAKGITPGTRTLTLIITDGTSGCTNTINKTIEIRPEPEIDLAITTTVATTICQTRDLTPDDNRDEAYWPVGTPLVNTFTYTITPDITNAPADYSYSYRIDIPTTSTLNGYSVVYSGVGTPAYNTNYIIISDIDEEDLEGTGTLTVTFNTTTGLLSQSIEAKLSLGSLVLASGGTGSYDATYSAPSATVTVGAVPTIGQFN